MLAKNVLTGEQDWRPVTEIFIIPDKVVNNISQKQMRHVAVAKSIEGVDTWTIIDDAQIVLNSFNSGAVNILGKSKQGFPIVKAGGMIGINVSNVASGTYKQAANIFMIKGTKSPSVVPMNPNWSSK